MEALKALVPGLERGAENGRNHYYECPANGPWTADKIIQILIGRELRKRERSRRCGGGRYRKRAEVNAELIASLSTPEGEAAFLGEGIA